MVIFQYITRLPPTLYWYSFLFPMSTGSSELVVDQSFVAISLFEFSRMVKTARHDLQMDILLAFCDL